MTARLSTSNPARVNAWDRFLTKMPVCSESGEGHMGLTTWILAPFIGISAIPDPRGSSRNNVAHQEQAAAQARGSARDRQLSHAQTVAAQSEELLLVSRAHVPLVHAARWRGSLVVPRSVRHLPRSTQRPLRSGVRPARRWRRRVHRLGLLSRADYQDREAAIGLRDWNLSRSDRAQLRAQ